MTAAVNNMRSLTRRLALVRQRPVEARPSLLAFFLFDERRSQRPVQTFVDTERPWLDSLARSSNILLLFFRQTVPNNTNDENDVLIVEGNAKSINPSLEVAAKFGIRPNQLPGIVFFQDLNFESQKSAQGVYWRLPLESFEEDRNILEREVARLFAMVQTARRNAHDAKSMFDELSSALAKMQRSDADRQFMALLGRGLMQVVKYPGKLIELVMTGFGKGYGEALASKYS